MADEFTTTFTMSLSNGEIADSISVRFGKYDQSAEGYSSGTFTVGTSEEAISFNSDISSEGFLFIRNADDTNWVEYGPESGGVMVSFGKILAQEWSWLRLKPAVVLRMKANSAPVRVELRLYEA